MKWKLYEARSKKRKESDAVENADEFVKFINFDLFPSQLISDVVIGVAGDRKSEAKQTFDSLPNTSI